MLASQALHVTDRDMLASQALHVTDREPPAALGAFVSSIRAIVAPVEEDRVLGPELQKLAEWFTREVFEG
jgi:histidine ammonia-lyase